MLPLQVAAVAVRLFAVWLGITALRMLPSLFIVGEGKPPGYVYDSFIFAITALASLVLWFFPRLVVGKIVSRSLENDTPASPDAWLAMGSALLGLWMLTYAFPALVRDAYVLQSAESDYSDTSTIKSWVLYNVVEVAIALWLIFGARGFRRLFWWARTAGLSKQADE